MMNERAHLYSVVNVVLLLMKCSLMVLQFVLFSFWAYSWLEPLFFRGWRKGLLQEDLYRPAASAQSQLLLETFHKYASLCITVLVITIAIYIISCYT